MDIQPSLPLDLPPHMVRALRAQARAHGRSKVEEARAILSRALTATPAKTNLGSDEGVEDRRDPLLAPLRALLASDLSCANGWGDLHTRLAKHGYTFRERGGGLALYCTATAARICKASDLGWTYSALMRRFDQPFPGHSHTHLAQRVLGRAVAPSDTENHPSLFSDLGESEDIILVEDE